MMLVRLTPFISVQIVKKKYKKYASDREGDLIFIYRKREAIGMELSIIEIDEGSKALFYSFFCLLDDLQR